VLFLFLLIILSIQTTFVKPLFHSSSFTHVVTSPYKIAILFECKHSQKAILHGSE